jgi:hypothetical protein
MSHSWTRLSDSKASIHTVVQILVHLYYNYQEATLLVDESHDMVEIRIKIDCTQTQTGEYVKALW